MSNWLEKEVIASLRLLMVFKYLAINKLTIVEISQEESA
jgi:hypothetical protein